MQQVGGNHEALIKLANLIQSSPVKIHPVNWLQIAAYLESMGITDLIAQKDYNYADVFELAKDVSALLPPAEVEYPDEKQHDWHKEIMFFFKNYLRGGLYSLPLIITLLLLLFFRISLWSSLDLKGGQPTALYLATVFSLIISGGLSQGIARKSISYISYLQFGMSRKISWYLTKTGLIIVFSISVILALVNWFFSILPFSIFGYFLPFFILLSIMWILANLLYILRKGIWYSFSLIVGVILVLLLVKVLEVPLFPAQLIGLTLTDIIICSIIIWGFHKKATPNPEQILNMPKPSSIFASIRLYSLFGWSYFLFIFIDRFNGFTVAGSNIPYTFWYRGEYELGMNIAVMVIVISSGFIEYVVASFFETLRRTLNTKNENNTLYVRQSMSKFYKKRMLLFIALIFGGSIIVTTIFLYIRGIIDALVGNQINLSITTLVFFAGLVSYSFLLVGLFNTILCFSMSRPELANHAILKGLAVNFICGYIFARVFGYYFAVLGLGIGALVFMVISFRNIRNLLQYIDFYYYASFLG